MKHWIVTAISLALFSCHAEPALANGQSAGVVQSASCVEVARQHSVAGAIGGGAVGAGLGSVLGGALGGKTGRMLGGIVGSVGGGVAGERMLSTSTYQCAVVVQTGSKQRFLTTVGPQYSVGEQVLVTDSENGVFVSK